MPRFYIHVCNGHGFAEDHDGHELPDAAAARESAIRGAREIMAADVRRGELDLSSFVEVEDADRRLLFTLTFAEVVDVKRRHGPPPTRDGRERVNH